MTDRSPSAVFALRSQDLQQLSTQISRAVSDLHHVNGRYGWGRILILFGVLFAGGWLYWHSAYWGVAFSGLVLLGLAESGLFVATHEALHGTLLAQPRWERLLSCLISWPMLFPVSTYRIIHLFHHRWNSVDRRDPERITIRRWPWLRLAICAGGLGLIVKTWQQGWVLRGHDSSLRSQLMVDAVGIVLVNGALLWVAATQGCLWRYVLSWFVVERIVGLIMQSRALVEHWGVWYPRQNFLLSQLYGCRNVQACRLLNTVMGGLPHHGAHHAFPGIPFDHLAEASSRIEALLRAHGLPPLPRSSGYLVALRQL